LFIGKQGQGHDACNRTGGVYRSCPGHRLAGCGAWIEPGTQVLQSNERGYCPLPPSARQVAAPVRPDHDLLLFIYSLSQRGFLG